MTTEIVELYNRLWKDDVSKTLTKMQQKYLPDTIGKVFTTANEEIYFYNQMLEGIIKERQELLPLFEEIDRKMKECNNEFSSSEIVENDYLSNTVKLRSEEDALLDNLTLICMCEVEIRKRKDHLMMYATCN